MRFIYQNTLSNEPHCELVTCSRVGAPPLKFKGMRIAHSMLKEEEQPCEKWLSISLWQRLRGGFTASYFVADKAGWQPCATTKTNIGELIDAVEQVFSAERCIAVGPSSSVREFASMIMNEAIMKQRHDAYRDLVGMALDVWMRQVTDASHFTTNQAVKAGT